jgi:ribosomal protein L11 methylase PrmA
MTWTRDRGSFRDPSGFVFFHDGTAYRQVNASCADAFRGLMRSGLYHELVSADLLVGHEEVELRLSEAPLAHAVLRPQQIPFISYPYEWCFSQLKAAALLTLDIQRRALARNLVLRDASAYNVQFIGSRPVFIDTLSFGPYVDGEPWAAYRQFCQHFLAPLAMMAMVEPSLGDLARTHIDGVPLALANRVLPFHSRFKPGLLMHLHLHGRSEVKTNGAPVAGPKRQRAVFGRATGMSKRAVLGLIDSLDRTVRQLSWKPPSTLWSTYSSHLNYSDAAQERKRVLVAQMLGAVQARSALASVWDLGGNTGRYSRLAAETGARVISFDSDHAVIEYQFTTMKAAESARILPLVQNLANPSPSIGWNHAERRSLTERGPAGVAMALAVVHHLAIGGNVPLPAIAEFLRGICRNLIIEFVPKEDSQVQRMLEHRDDVFDDYSQLSFEQSFAAFFTIVQSVPIDGTARTLYLMERR